MRKVIAVFVVVIAAVSPVALAGGRFVPFEKQAVAGSYSGPSEAYGIVLEVAPDGVLRGNYVEMGSVAVLSSIAVRGSEFTASASFDDGTLRTISGSFTKRGDTFGLQLHSVPVEDVGMVDTFFEKL